MCSEFACLTRVRKTKHVFYSLVITMKSNKDKNDSREVLVSTRYYLVILMMLDLFAWTVTWTGRPPLIGWQLWRLYDGTMGRCNWKRENKLSLPIYVISDLTVTSVPWVSRFWKDWICERQFGTQCATLHWDFTWIFFLVFFFLIVWGFTKDYVKR